MSDVTLTEEAITLWIGTILTITDTAPQRHAFIDGYNGVSIAPRASPQMKRRYVLGGQVRDYLARVRSTS